MTSVNAFLVQPFFMNISLIIDPHSDLLNNTTAVFFLLLPTCSPNQIEQFDPDRMRGACLRACVVQNPDWIEHSHNTKRLKATKNVSVFMTWVFSV